MLKIAIASGKGGTGKTTMAVHLAVWYSKKSKTVLVDLDVDAPDALAYFPSAITSKDTVPVAIKVPHQKEGLCIACGACKTVCNFGALFAIKNIVSINPISCKGCGRCVRACPTNALVEGEVIAGNISASQDDELTIIQGLLAVGDIRSPSVIELTKVFAEKDTFEMVIRDCPPGVTCPTVRAVHGADFCILIAEPTPFSLHDIEKAVCMVESLGIPYGLVINKVGAGNADILSLVQKYNIKVLAELPWNREFAEAGANALLCMDVLVMQAALESIASNIKKMLKERNPCVK